MNHNQETLKQWMASEKNVNPSKLFITTYEPNPIKDESCKD